MGKECVHCGFVAGEDANVAWLAENKPVADALHEAHLREMRQGTTESGRNTQSIDPTPRRVPGKRGVPLPGETAAQAVARDGNVFGVKECSWLEDDAVVLAVTHFKDGAVSIMWERPNGGGFTSTGLRTDQSEAWAAKATRLWDSGDSR